MANIETGLLEGKVPFIRGGSGARDAVVFFGANALFKRLEKTSGPERYARYVARLLPGHRFTILGYVGSAFEEITRDMAAVIRTPPAVLLGIFLGGLVAMRFAAQYRGLVSRLVLLASAHRFSPGGCRMMERQFEALEKGGGLLTLVRENATLFRRPWYNWPVQLKLWKDARRVAADFRDPAAILRDYRQLFGQDFQNNAAYAKRISCPARGYTCSKRKRICCP